MTSLRTRQRLVRRLRQAGIQNEAVLKVMLNMPRHLFVEEALASRAYEDTALPIGFGQTISQPYIVARMTEVLLGHGPLDTVLEVGTGSAYQTAVLAALVERVYSVERVGRLLERARERMRNLRFNNVRLKHDDGQWGWPRYAPFDGILVTAACREIPAALIDQLAIGGRLVAPVGASTEQDLVQVERHAMGKEEKNLGAVSFVPLLGGVL